jgi:hypothetical protein
MGVGCWIGQRPRRPPDRKPPLDREEELERWNRLPDDDWRWKVLRSRDRLSQSSWRGVVWRFGGV